MTATDNVLAGPLRVGFTQSFPVKEIVKEYPITIEHDNKNYSINVQEVKVTFGDNNQYHCTALLTEQVDIASTLPLGGFGSYSHIEEAAIMREAVNKVMSEYDYTACNEVCSWPFVKVVVNKKPL